jgi:hypothetical protein
MVGLVIWLDLYMVGLVFSWTGVWLNWYMVELVFSWTGGRLNWCMIELGVRVSWCKV